MWNPIEIKGMTEDDLKALILNFTPPDVVLHKEGDPYNLIGFVDHVIDWETMAVVMWGTALNRRHLGYMDEALHNLYRTVAATEHVAAVRHGLSILPAGATMYAGEYAFGVGGFGVGPYGGSELEQVPVKLTCLDMNTVKVYTSQKYSGFTEVNRLSESSFALSKPDSTTTLTLLLR